VQTECKASQLEFQGLGRRQVVADFDGGRISSDGEMSAVVEFASAEALAAWRDHPDHRKAQQRGRNDFYAEYEIINCTLLHRYG